MNKQFLKLQTNSVQNNHLSIGNGLAALQFGQRNCNAELRDGLQVDACFGEESLAVR